MLAGLPALFVLAGLTCGSDGPTDGSLQTIAESSDYQATARYDDVVALCRKLDERSDLVRMDELGKTHEGRSIPMLVIGEPPIDGPEAAKTSGKLVVLVIGNIHAGEVCGKEALPMLVRELTEPGAPASPLLEKVVLLVAPIFNADGNERVSKDNRPGQVGPAEGMGQRPNAQGFDLNRDFVKLESPEVRGLVKTLNMWDPHVFIDTHTTNGSLHRYVLTYQGPQHPAGNRDVLKFTRDKLLPAIDLRFEQATGQKAFYYGDFDPSHEHWVGYPPTPRFGTNYVGLRDRIAILSEAYAYAPYKDRVLATRDYVRSCLETLAGSSDEVLKVLSEARKAARSEERAQQVALQTEARPLGESTEVLGYVEERKDNHWVPGEPKDYRATVMLDHEPTLTVTRPYAYLIPARYTKAIETLALHGIEMRQLRESLVLPVTSRRVAELTVAANAFQGHRTVELTVDPPSEAQPKPRMIEAGTVMVPTAQTLGNLASYLLEAASADGLTTWNFFDENLAAGRDFPVVRLESAPAFAITTAAVVPMQAEGNVRKQRFSFDMMLNGTRGPNLTGTSPRIDWLDAGHWLQERGGRLQKVDARTGESAPFVDRDALAKALAKVEGIDETTARALAGNPSQELDSQKQEMLFEREGDLYYARLDGSAAARLTTKEGREELAEFSPDGKLVAFVRDNDLYVVDVATATERALTTGGSDRVRHGKADWVYYEEIFNRNWKGFWWSPDSKSIALLEIDNRRVKPHVVVNDTVTPRDVEETPYPRSGDPNPFVRVGIVAASGGDVKWANLGEYKPEDLLVSRLGWWADSSRAYAYATNRTQTWLDLLTIDPADGTTHKLFRDSTSGWIENPGEVLSLKDGGFLYPSERTDYKHIYRFNADGSEPKALTSGEWEVRDIVHVDEPGGWVYFTGTKDAPMSENLYRVSLNGGEVERLTHAEGPHKVKLNPDASLFFDTWSDTKTPPRSAVFDQKGEEVRVVEANPLPDLQSWEVAPSERVRITTKDGFVLEGEVVLPLDLDPSKKYPVWTMTYAGPHYSSVSDGWPGGRRMDQALAAEGFVVFRIDPRSASGKGLKSAQAAYKHLGVKELEDIEEAIAWLKKEKPFVDPDRIGLAGHSYGGYMTSYALTHSKTFAAGIAGAPVTDWHDYDSIYTERFMLTPDENPEGYKVSSVVGAAANLHGKLLILHGGIDDNVSVRNTMRLVEALQRANKDFELMIYPSSRHGIFGPHYTKIQIDFIRRTLGGGPK